jgi:hypothetical protein
VGKINIDRNRLSYIEKDCLKKNHATAAAQVTAELNEDPVSTKTVQFERHKSSIHGRAATAKPLITKVMLRCVNDGVMTIKP